MKKKTTIVRNKLPISNGEALVLIVLILAGAWVITSLFENFSTNEVCTITLEGNAKVNSIGLDNVEDFEIKKVELELYCHKMIHFANIIGYSLS